MRSVRRWLVCSAAAVLLLASRGASASLISDFQARLAQANWTLSQTEAIVRSQPHSSVPVVTPEVLASYLTLLSENVAALAATAANRGTDEQRKTMAAGLLAVAASLKDQASLSSSRGLTAASSAFGVLETSCRNALAQLS